MNDLFLVSTNVFSKFLQCLEALNLEMEKSNSGEHEEDSVLMRSDLNFFYRYEKFDFRIVIKFANVIVTHCLAFR